MDSRSHIHEENFPVDPEKMFNILVTPSAICRWWGAASAIVIPEQGGFWCAVWGENEDDPDYVVSYTINEFQPPHKILFGHAKYHAKTGPLPFEPKMTTEFSVIGSNGGCTLKVIQDGFPTDPIADEFYEACAVGWTNTFASIREYLDSES